MIQRPIQIAHEPYEPYDSLVRDVEAVEPYNGSDVIFFTGNDLCGLATVPETVIQKKRIVGSVPESTPIVAFWENADMQAVWDISHLDLKITPTLVDKILKGHFSPKQIAEGIFRLEEIKRAGTQ